MQAKLDNLHNTLCALGQKGVTVDPHLRLYKFALLSPKEIEDLYSSDRYKPNKFFSVSRGIHHVLHETDHFTALKPADKNKKRVFFVIEGSGKNAVDIQHFTPYKKEKEALFLPSVTFKINKIRQNGDFLQVYMRYVED